MLSVVVFEAAILVKSMYSDKIMIEYLKKSENMEIK